MDRINEEATCPCCDQFAKIYRRKINSGIAATLVKLYNRFAMNWTHLATWDHSREASKAEYWGLIENQPSGVGGKSPMWRLTSAGLDFVRNRSRVAKYAAIYDGTLLGLDDTETVSIEDALGTRFNYNDLMAGV